MTYAVAHECFNVETSFINGLLSSDRRGLLNLFDEDCNEADCIFQLILQCLNVAWD